MLMCSVVGFLIIMRFTIYIRVFFHGQWRFTWQQGKGGDVPSTSWKCSNSWKFSCHFVHTFRTDWNFLAKFDSSDASLNRSILTFLYLKFETSARMRKLQLFITTCHLQFSWHDINLKLTLGILFDKWSWSMILSTWSRGFFWKFFLLCEFCIVLLLNLLRPKVNFMACLNVNIFIKKL